MRRDPLTPLFDNTELYPIFSKSKQLIQTVQHDGQIKMCSQINYIYIFELFYYLLSNLQNRCFQTIEFLYLS